MFEVTDKAKTEIGIKVTTGIIEGQVITEYGIIYKQIHQNIVISTEIPCISPNFRYVTKLAETILKNDVDPRTLQDIVEDYIVEYSDYDDIADYGECVVV